MASLIKALPKILLRVFTVHRDIENREVSDPPVESEIPSAVALTIVERRKRMIGLIIPILMWHGSQRQYTSTSWCICTLYTIQILGGINSAGIECQIRALGVVVFSLINAAVTFSIYLLYFLAVRQSTSSSTQAIVQLLFLAVPDAMDIAQNARRVYTEIIEERARILHHGPQPSVSLCN